MKKNYFFAFFFFIAGSALFAQQLKIAWISDMHVGSKEADENVVKVINDINHKQFDFALISGDITGAGSNKDLETAKHYLDKLKISYFILPGNHDTKRSESGCTKFSMIWGEDKFVVEREGIVFVGLNSSICFRGHGGHFAPETLDWLKTKLAEIGKEKPIIIVMHHLINNMTDNWFDLVNSVNGYNIKAFLCGHGHANAKGEMNGVPVIMARATLNNKNGWGYCSFNITKDSLLFFEENGEKKTTKLYSLPANKNLNVIPVDTSRFINYNAEILANIELNKTIVSGVAANEKNIAAVTNDGTVYCYDLQGRLLWSNETWDSFISSPAIVGDYVVAGSVKGNLYLYERVSGTPVEKINTEEVFTSRFITDNMKTIFAGTASGAMYCFEIPSMKQVWKNSDAAGVIECEPLIFNGKLFYGSWDTYLNKVDLTTGKTEWRWQGENKAYLSPAACKPMCDGKSVYIATPDNILTAINLADGKTNWRSEKTGCLESIGLSDDKSKLYIKGVSGKFFYSEPANGNITDSIKFQNSSETMCSEVVEDNGRIFFTTQTGMVYCIEKGGILKQIMFMGVSRSHKVIALKNNLYAVSDMDGRIVVFKVK